MLTILLSFAVLCPARAERPVPPVRGAYSAQGELGYFQTSGNYEGGGSPQMDNGTSLENFEGTALGTYDFNKVIRVMAGFSMAQTTTESLDVSGSGFNLGNVSRTSRGINEITAGAMGWFDFGPISLAPAANIYYPAWRLSEDSNDPLIGEGAMRVRAGSWGILSLSSMIQPFVYGAYEHRDGGRASLFHYSLGSHADFGRFWAQAEFRGYSSIGNDSDSDSDGRLVRDAYLIRVNGGSHRFYSVNPSASEAAVQGGIRLGQVTLYAGFATTVMGESAANGNLFFGGLVFSGKLKLREPKVEEPEDPFRFQKDKYDESVFKEQDEIDKKKIKKRIRKQPSVDKLLHETEKELQKD